MLTFVVKYWLEVLFGLIVGALTFACKKIWKLYQDEKKRQKTKEQESLYTELKQVIIQNGEDCKANNEQLIKGIQEELNIVKHGVLNMQGKVFKNQCREYLDENRKVTLAEYESLEEDHAIYNSLDGNHDGDMLFAMVEEKVKKDLSE